MGDSSGYTPPRVWTWDKESGGRFASINRPIAGPTLEKELADLSKTMDRRLASLRKEIEKAERQPGTEGARLLRETR